ncbi:hypothetical protein [Mitsuokella sp. WILCCON 0060]|uniref:hypothetical protein n=1 Tax=Mitsuokella sp. WILCCON 0060 TaxID=3345341 RepID=UPI003F1B87EA
MIKENPYGIDTPYGFKRFVISNGDILEYEQPYDLLVLSARQGSYVPMEGTLIKSLYQIGIDVHRLTQNLEFDWRYGKHVWLSKTIDFIPVPFDRIAGIEFTRRNCHEPNASTVHKRLKAFFSMLMAAEYMGIHIHKIVMPVLGANLEHVPADLVIEAIKDETEEAFMTIPSLLSVHIIERDPERYQILSNAFDRIVGRQKVDLSIANLDDGAREKIVQIVEQVKQIMTFRKRTPEEEKSFLDVIHQLEEIKSYPLHNVRFQIRLLAELIATDLIGLKGNRKWKKKTLLEQIDILTNECGLSTWIRSYWHIMRELGNEAVHITEKHPNSEDMNILFRCAAEVVQAWMQVYQQMKG